MYKHRYLLCLIEFKRKFLNFLRDILYKSYIKQIYYYYIQVMCIFYTTTNRIVFYFEYLFHKGRHGGMPFVERVKR